MSTDAQRELHLFSCEGTQGSGKYVFADGMTASFIDGKFATDNEKQITELLAEIKLGIPHIKFVRKITADELDPVEVLRKRFIAEYLADTKAKASYEHDRGTSQQGKLNVANTATISEGAADSSSADGASVNASVAATPGAAVSSARLANLGKR